MEETQSEKDEKVLKDIETILETWGRMANLLRGGLVTMGVLAIACSICIGTFTGSLCTITIKILAASSTLFLTIISAYSLPAKANNVRKGWRHLNKGIYNYRCGAITINQLIEVYEEGEILIGDVDFNYEKPHLDKSQNIDKNKKNDNKNQA